MIEYVPDQGSKWIGVVRRGRVLMVPSASSPLIEALWEAVAATEPVPAVLEVMTRDGIQDAPQFALAVPVGATEVHAVVRGGFRVRGSGEAMTGARVSTWSEHVLETDGSFEVVAPFARAAGAGWRLVEGVVATGCVRVGERAATASPAAGAAGSDATGSEATGAADATPAAKTASEPDAPAAAAEALPEPEAAAEAVKPTGAAPAVAAAPSADAPAGGKPPAANQTSANPPAAVAPVTAPVEATLIPEQTLLSVDDEVEDRTVVIARGAKPAPVADDSLEEDGTIALPSIQRLRRERGTASGGGAKTIDAAAMPAATSSASAPTSSPGAASTPSIHLALPGQAREALTGEIVLGRSPGVTRAVGGRLPRLVTIGAGDPDISRSHVKVGLHGGTVVVTDLDSRNGTVIIQPGRPPVRLRAGEDTPVLVGTVIDLGGGWSVKVEEGD
ncbi:FHA domain-containing protein [Agromyces sp. CFH 90414]|uniref:FHA domain-containing protein n=1 Tax=Agromyces agglutinans TaxID=2662258 RepID=A0A6I2F2Y9_9MICO|nr:FHA domain-containing protein [Agromyces agglutinans]MRG58744.1 FHA domain-containing protein [Agromyces agglutinans]